jgi:hypothetical protein
MRFHVPNNELDQFLEEKRKEENKDEQAEESED